MENKIFQGVQIFQAKMDWRSTFLGESIHIITDLILNARKPYAICMHLHGYKPVNYQML